MQFAYMASPYTGPDIVIVKQRAMLAAYYAAKLVENQTAAIFSPIVHGHQLHQYVTPGSVPHEGWMQQDLAILAAAEILLILPLAGWRKSEGMKREIALARSLELPIYFLQEKNETAYLLERVTLLDLDSLPAEVLYV